MCAEQSSVVIRLPTPSMTRSSRHAPTGRSRKMLLQRHYRWNEAEDFLQLRQLIRAITREDPHKRHDILIKAANTIRQLFADYHSLLAEQAASTSASTSTAGSNTGSPMQYPASVHPVPYGPTEGWLVNYDLPMPTHPDVPVFSSPDITHGDTHLYPNYAATNLSNMDDWDIPSNYQSG
ncbi:uncharacterized protein EDB93DRAFT_766267 [Suillus bovinus]|uniref:uncharacterized protein n=1 Tax=Suillus bovinus TaxID=48563 RepID=UPI001B86B1D1|nr:uncharacterized protein EDB93DRAFT_766267 [Suillus bovinus]KAG2137435.1 hypothetical protein EDB93DRAFT_766267 [Suillus bovinus]